MCHVTLLLEDGVHLVTIFHRRHGGGGGGKFPLVNFSQLT